MLGTYTTPSCCFCIKAYGKLISDVAKTVDIITISTKKMERFESIQQTIYERDPLKLIQDVDTRWNSTFLMLRRVLQLREAVTRAMELMVELKNIRVCWDDLIDVVKFLKPIFDITNKISNGSSNTISIVAPILKQELSCGFSNIHLEEAATNFITKI